MKKATTIILVITLILTTLTLASCSQKDINNQTKPINFKVEVIHISGDIVIAKVGTETTTINISEQYLTLGAIKKYEHLEVKSGDIVEIRITEGRISDINMVKSANH